MNDIFEKQEISLKIIKPVYYDKERISYLGPKTWNLVTASIKDSENVNILKSIIKISKPESCPSRLWKVSLPQIGLI